MDLNTPQLIAKQGAESFLAAKEPDLKAFQSPALSYTVTARDMLPTLGALDYLQLLFPFIKVSQVESLFGFTSEFAPMYGGRLYHKKHTLRRHHLDEMESAGIGVSLNLSNHFFSKEVYESSLSLLERHHKQGNSITCFNDEFARQLKSDFPNYVVKASLIKHLNSLGKIDSALEIYDNVVIPMDKNDDFDFLANIPEKHRITLFANASCAYNCASRSCYVGFSQEMQGMEVTSECSIPVKPREDLGKVFFDVAEFESLGFTHMKLIPPVSVPERKQRFRHFQSIKNWWFFEKQQVSQNVIQVASYPKSGRTWLRFFLACYFQKLYKLDIDLDLETMFSLLPNANKHYKLGKPGFNFALRKQIPTSLFTHAPPSDLDDLSDGKTLLLLRGIMDTLVSEYFHFNGEQDFSKEAIQSYLFASPEQGVARLCDYLNDWARQVKSHQVTTVTYEEMTASPEDTFKQVLEVFGIEIDQKLIEECIRASSFEKMKQLEEECPIGTENIDQQTRMRKGRVDAYSNYLSADAIGAIKQYCEDNLLTDTKSLLNEKALWPITSSS